MRVLLQTQYRHPLEERGFIHRLDVGDERTAKRKALDLVEGSHGKIVSVVIWKLLNGDPHEGYYPWVEVANHPENIIDAGVGEVTSEFLPRDPRKG